MRLPHNCVNSPGWGEGAAPLIISVDPAGMTTNDPPTTFTIHGSGFESDSEVLIDYKSVSATFVDSNTMTVVFDAIMRDDVPIFVRNASGAQSNSVILDVVLPPWLTGNATWNSFTTVLEVERGVTVGEIWAAFPPPGTLGPLFVNGTDIGPRVFGATREPGEWAWSLGVIYIDPIDADGVDHTSFLQPLSGTNVRVEWPYVPPTETPTMSSITPNVIQQPDVVTLTIIGTGLMPTTQVLIDDVPQPVTYISPTELTVLFDSAEARPNNLQLDLLNGYRSNWYGSAVEVLGSPVTLTSITPNTGVAGVDLPVVIAGTGFGQWTTLVIGAYHTGATVVSPTEMTTTLAATSVMATPGVFPVVVMNGASAESNELSFTVT